MKKIFKPITSFFSNVFEVFSEALFFLFRKRKKPDPNPSSDIQSSQEHVKRVSDEQEIKKHFSKNGNPDSR